MKRFPAHALSILSFSARCVTGQNANQNGSVPGTTKDFTREIKRSLNATDEQWAVLKPLVENVSNKQREIMGFSLLGRQGWGRETLGESTTPAEKASKELCDRLGTKSADPQELKAKLNALGDSRRRAYSELKEARVNLRKVLTVDQEAYFVSSRMLD